MARPKSKDKNQKRYYAYKEYIMYENEELIFFVGLTNSISRDHPNGYQRLHNNIPCWKETTDGLISNLGNFKNISDFNSTYPIKRSYGKYFTNYWEAKKRFHQMVFEIDPPACYNFVECTGIDQDTKYIQELEVSLDSSTNAVISNSSS